MGRIHVTRRDGAEEIVDAQDGWSVMEAIRDGGIDELLALCGGCCACATCHVHVDADWLERTGQAEGDEADLLAESPNRTPASRLSCQLSMRSDLDGLRVTIPPED